MPRALQAHRFPLLFIVACSFLFARGAGAQGFEKLGLSKKKVTLHRKLPAVFNFTGTKFQVKVSSSDPKHNDVASVLKDRLETEISKSNPRLQADEKSPELIITCKVTGLDQPPDVLFSNNETTLAKSAPNAQGKTQTKAVESAVQYKKVKGSLDISYGAYDRSHRTLDSKNVSAKYSEDFNAATNQAANQTALEKFESPFKRMVGKKTEVAAGPPSPSELRDKLINDAVDQIVPRITTTSETIEVLLARGKLDDANKSAEGGLWTRYLEQLEQMPPFPKTKDDAYRLYNIGVAYEALAYQAESEPAEKKFLQDSTINYGLAVDAKPDEKDFIESKKRIETAMSYMRKLEAERHEFEVANARPAAPPENTGGTSAGNKNPEKTIDKSPGKTRTADGTKTSSSTDANADAGVAKTSNGAAKTPAKAQAAKPGKTVTNDDIIKMTKGHVDESTIIATIHDAPVVDFDLSSDGNVALTKEGVSSNVLAAMRARAKLPNRRTPNPGNT
jgi:hypothetical protein